MNSSTTSLAAELIFRTLCDPLPKTKIDAAYLFGQTSCNQDSTFSAALASTAERILILDTAPRSGYSGFAVWSRFLQERGVAPERLEAVPMNDDLLLHSRSESQALIRHAIHQGFRSVEVIAPPFHQVRAFMTVITIALEEDSDLAIYSRPGMPLPWNEKVVHSQGILEAQRSQLIHEEMARIETYQKKGDLASFERVLAYLNRRKPVE